jgi:DUF971 family protein
MIATKIKLSSSDELAINWDDNHASVISLHTLRDNCPCAGCQGETVLLKTYIPQPQQHLPGRYKLTGIQQVGHYAIQISGGMITPQVFTRGLYYEIFASVQSALLKTEVMNKSDKVAIQHSFVFHFSFLIPREIQVEPEFIFFYLYHSVKQFNALHCGRLAQLVQSVRLTRVRSQVRSPQRPQR